MLQPSFDPDPREIVISSSYTLIICTCTEYIPPELQNIMHVSQCCDNDDDDDYDYNDLNDDDDGNGDINGVADDYKDDDYDDTDDHEC